MGERVAALREQLGWSQRDLARTSGLSQSTLSRVESGRREATAAETVLLAGALGATVPELTGDSPVSREVRCAARATGEEVDAMLAQMVHYLEIADFLDRQGIPR